MSTNARNSKLSWALLSLVGHPAHSILPPFVRLSSRALAPSILLSPPHNKIMFATSSNMVTFEMEKFRTRSMSSVKKDTSTESSHQSSDAAAASSSIMPSRLRRITSLPGWPQTPRSPKEIMGSGSSGSAATAAAAPQDDTGGNDVVVAVANTTITDIKPSSKSNLRRIASTPSRVFRTSTLTHAADLTTTQNHTGNMSEESPKAFSKGISRRPSVIRLRRMASMPARGLRRMTSRPNVPSADDTKTSKPSEGKYLSRMRSWSGSVRGGTSRWFGNVGQPHSFPLPPC